MTRVQLTEARRRLAAGVITAGALVGAGIGVAVDVLWHRHRRA